MKILKYSIYVIVLLSMGCKKDKFSQIKTIDLPTTIPKLAATTFLSNDSEEAQIYVSHTKDILDVTNYDVLDEATVRILKDNQTFLDLEFNSSDGYFSAPLPSQNSFDNGTFKLEVSAAGYEPISATQVLPKRCEILAVEFKEDAVSDGYGDLSDLLEIEILDNESEENYYSVTVEAVGTDSNGDEIRSKGYVYSDDPLIEIGYNEDFFSDLTFNGDKYKMRIVLDQYWNYEFMYLNIDVEKLIINVNSHTKDYYRYSTTRLTYEDSQDIPFIEPVLIYTNFDNGFGIFSLKNTSEAEYVF